MFIEYIFIKAFYQSLKSRYVLYSNACNTLGDLQTTLPRHIFQINKPEIPSA